MKIISPVSIRFLVVFAVSVLSVCANAELYIGGNLSQMHFKAVSVDAESPSAEVDFHQFRMDDAERLTLLFGIDPASSWRMDFELTRQLKQSTSKVVSVIINDGSSGNAGNFAVDTNYANTLLMYNNYMDIDLTGNLEKFKPYIGMGVGIVQHDVDEMTLVLGATDGQTFKGEKTTDFAWQLKLGGAYQLPGGAAIDISASYLDAGRAESDKTAVGLGEYNEPLSWDVRGWVFGIGIRAPL